MIFEKISPEKIAHPDMYPLTLPPTDYAENPFLPPASLSRIAVL
jgi:hypothetical protein